MAMTLQPRRPQLSGKRHWSGLSILSKHSYATSAFEADDELSDSEMSSDSGHDGASNRRALTPQYTGHDARPTSPKELAGWYIYGVACEPFIISGIGIDPPELQAPRYTDFKREL